MSGGRIFLHGRAEFYHNGLPVDTGSVQFFENETSTPKDVYSDYDLSVSIGNTITLDAQGRAVIFLGAGFYTVEVYDVDAVLLFSQDDITADRLTDQEVEDAYNRQVTVVTQAQAEDCANTTVYRWTPQRVCQAIDAKGGTKSVTKLLYSSLPHTIVEADNGTLFVIDLDGQGAPADEGVNVITLPAETTLSDGWCVSFLLINHNDTHPVYIKDWTDTEQFRLSAENNHAEITTDSVEWFISRLDPIPGNFKARKTENQDIDKDTWTKITYNDEIWDQNRDYEDADSKWIPESKGTAHVIASMYVDAPGDGSNKDVRLAIYLNGAKYDETTTWLTSSSGGASSTVISTTVPITDPGNDEIEVYCNFDGDDDVLGDNARSNSTFFLGYMTH